MFTVLPFSFWLLKPRNASTEPWFIWSRVQITHETGGKLQAARRSIGVGLSASDFKWAVIGDRSVQRCVLGSSWKTATLKTDTHGAPTVRRTNFPKATQFIQNEQTSCQEQRIDQEGPQAHPEGRELYQDRFLPRATWVQSPQRMNPGCSRTRS